MTATFIGEDGSMGLSRGTVYSFKFTQLGFFDRLFGEWPFHVKIVITVRRAPFDFVTIPYQSTVAFMSNWDELRKQSTS